MGSITQQPRVVELHGRRYNTPQQPTIVVCVDGFDPEYIEAGCRDGILPTLSSWMQHGFHATGKCTMPSVTNTNNLSIITGMASNVHGVSGNYYLDKKTGEEHMVLDDSTMWGSTILEQMANAGVRVAAITAKDKLRRIINHGLTPANGAICFSAQHADECTMEANGIKDVPKWLGLATPPQYSGELSIFVMQAGLKLLQEGRADLFYLTLSDFVQHKHAPGSVESNAFLQELDAILGAIERAGAVVALTADHGMSAKTDEAGKPNVLYLEDYLNEHWPGAGARVICPIADPFVKHHGALGGFVRVHLTKSTEDIKTMVEACRELPRVEVALLGVEAAERYEMPLEREGDLVVISKSNAVVGAKETDHDLSQLGDHHLRSHGGLSEQDVPLFKSVPLKDVRDLGSRTWSNRDIFDVALNL